MKLKPGLIILSLLFIDFILLFFILLHGNNNAILNPQGFIAFQQKNLIILAVLLMLCVAIPVFIAAFYIAHKYREGNTKAKYTPDVDHNHKLQALWWGILSFVILILCVINWQATHALDPSKSIKSSAKPLTIEVVALQWKWMFIYPEQHIATVNYIVFPEKTPLVFKLTGNAPMNSFWIPQLGGQMYAMTGMVTTLHLMADKTGEYRGSSAEISGAEFAGMTFKAKSVSASEFAAWVESVKKSPQTLTFDEYKKLAKPSADTPATFYSSTEGDLCR